MTQPYEQNQLQKALSAPGEIQRMSEVARDPDIKQQLEELSQKAQAAFKELGLVHRAGATYEQSQPFADKILTYYHEAFNLRARQIGETDLASRVQDALEIGGGIDKSIIKNIVTIAKKADGNPAEITALTLKTQRGFMQVDKQGHMSIDVREYNKAIIDINRVMDSTMTNPQQKAVLQELKNRLDAQLHIDPTSTLIQEAGTAINRYKSSTRPLRMAGAIGGSFLASIGIGIFLKTGKLSWPTAMWGFIAAYSINPKMLDNAATKGVDTIAAVLSQDRIKFLQNNHLSGTEGRQMMEEFFALSAQSKTRKALAKLNANGELIDSKLEDAGVSGKLLAFMKGQDMTARADFIRLFGEMTNKNDQKILLTYVERRLEIGTTR